MSDILFEPEEGTSTGCSSELFIQKVLNRELPKRNKPIGMLMVDTSLPANILTENAPKHHTRSPKMMEGVRLSADYARFTSEALKVGFDGINRILTKMGKPQIAQTIINGVDQADELAFVGKIDAANKVLASILLAVSKELHGREGLEVLQKNMENDTVGHAMTSHLLENAHVDTLSFMNIGDKRRFEGEDEGPSKLLRQMVTDEAREKLFYDLAFETAQNAQDENGENEAAPLFQFIEVSKQTKPKKPEDRIKHAANTLTKVHSFSSGIDMNVRPGDISEETARGIIREIGEEATRLGQSAIEKSISPVEMMKEDGTVKKADQLGSDRWAKEVAKGNFKVHAVDDTKKEVLEGVAAEGFETLEEDEELFERVEEVDTEKVFIDSVLEKYKGGDVNDKLAALVLDIRKKEKEENISTPANILDKINLDKVEGADIRMIAQKLLHDNVEFFGDDVMDIEFGNDIQRAMDHFGPKDQLRILHDILIKNAKSERFENEAKVYLGWLNWFNSLVEFTKNVILSIVNVAHAANSYDPEEFLEELNEDDEVDSLAWKSIRWMIRILLSGVYAVFYSKMPRKRMTEVEIAASIMIVVMPEGFGGAMPAQYLTSFGSYLVDLISGSLFGLATYFGWQQLAGMSIFNVLVGGAAPAAEAGVVANAWNVAWAGVKTLGVYLKVAEAPNVAAAVYGAEAAAMVSPVGAAVIAGIVAAGVLIYLRYTFSNSGKQPNRLLELMVKHPVLTACIAGAAVFGLLLATPYIFTAVVQFYSYWGLSYGFAFLSSVATSLVTTAISVYAFGGFGAGAAASKMIPKTIENVGEDVKKRKSKRKHKRKIHKARRRRK